MKTKLKFTKLGLIVICVCCFSCKKENEQTDHIREDFKKEQNVSKAVDSSKKIFLFGKSDDAYALEYLNLLNFSNFGYSQYGTPATKNLIGDSLSLILYGIEKPQLMDLVAFSNHKDKMPYYTRILFTPGDSIFMNVRNGKIQFSGKNQAHYNFFLHLNDPLRQNWAHYKDDPMRYKKELYGSYQSKDSILSEYIKHNIVSEDFTRIVRSELKHEYLYNLILPRNISDETLSGAYKNNPNDIMYVYGTTHSQRENFFDFNKYFNGISIADFNNPDLINNDYFKRNLILYIRYVFANHTYLEYSRTNFLNEKEFIQKNLEGNLESYAMARLINDYYLKGFGHGDQDIELMKSLIIEYQDQFSEPSYGGRMNEILDDLNAYNFLLPKEVLNEKLLSSKGDSIRFGDILKKSPNQIKVIDFWGSWCPPCIVEFKKGANVRRKIKHEQNVNFLYFAVNEDQKTWHKNLSNLKNYIPQENQYLVLNGDKSKLLKHLLIRENSGKTYFSIPRYTILDSKDRVKSNNAPRPSDSLVFEKLIKQIQMNE